MELLQPTMLLSVVVAVASQVSILTLLMVLVGVRRSLVDLVELVAIKMLTLKHFLVHTALQSVAVVPVESMEEAQALEPQQLALV
jgi:hypothetical protein